MKGGTAKASGEAVSQSSGYFGIAAVRGLFRGAALTPEEEEALEKKRVREELGRGTWTLLHRMAANFEKQPTKKQQDDMVDFFRILSENYACSDCAAHFRIVLKEHPVRAAGNRDLSLWLCEVHNVVNKRLGKAVFSCTIEAITERWGECGCFDKEEKPTATA
jgi:FAD-linked sulfhydryl oxidase